MNIIYLFIAMFIVGCILTIYKKHGSAEDKEAMSNNAPVGDNIPNPNHEFNANTSSPNPFRAEVSYGTVLQDPYVRYDSYTPPLIYYNRHMTEKNLQEVDYIPRRIRPPHGPVFFQNNKNTPLKKIFDKDHISYPMRWHIMRRLNMPSSFM